MAKSKSSYVCQQCGANFGKWSGQCAECGAWNSLVEAPTVSMPHHKPVTKKASNYAGEQSSVMPLNAVPMSLDTRLPTGVGEFDRVLGGGLGVIPVLANPLSCYRRRFTWQKIKV